MGDRVWQVQKELEEFQAKARGTSEVQMSELMFIYSRRLDIFSVYTDVEIFT